MTERQVWVCVCGCITGMLYADGDFVCANCGLLADGTASFLDRAENPRISVDRKDAYKIVDMNSSYSAYNRILKHLTERRDEVVGFFVMYAGGQSSNWYSLEGDKQCDWAIAGLEEQKDYINAKFRDQCTVSVSRTETSEGVSSGDS